MELLLSFPLLILLAVIIFGFKSFTVVPQQEAYVVERLGRFHKVLNPGLNILIPFIDRIASKCVSPATTPSSPSTASFISK